MSLSVLSNFAASVAHQNLLQSQQAASASISKLSSGSRIVSASDDAASLAIGKGLQAEVAALNQASINAGQGVSVLQIADGAYANANDILVRLKTIAVQAASGQLSGTQRNQLNAEYTNLTSEINRISAVTDFNGTQLINGGFTVTTGTGATTLGSAIASSNGISSLAINGTNTAGNYTLTFGSGGSGASSTFTVASGSETFTGSIGSGSFASHSLSAQTNLVLTSTTAGSTDSVNLVLNTNLKDNADPFTTNNTITKAADFSATAGYGGLTLRGSQSAGNYSIAYSNTNNTFTVGNSGENFTGAISTTALSGTGTSSALTSGTVVTLTSTTATSTNTVDLVLNGAFDAASDVSNQAAFTVAGTNSQSFSFQVGANNTSNDQIAVTLNSLSASALGISGTDVTSVADAQSASTLITNAINQLQSFRATVGAGESRLNFAQSNIATASENLQSAQSSLLDVDVASEVSHLASKQILVQLGVAELAQANQLPQQLLRLLQ
jgi:flagellin